VAFRSAAARSVIPPTVWRRLVVPETITLPKLHQVFQAALGWTNSHLHEFVIGGVRYSKPDPDFDDELGHVDGRGIKLHKALGIDARCFDYAYDFGDDWLHVDSMNGSLEARLSKRIDRKRGDVFLRSDFSDLGGYDQVGRALRQLVQRGSLFRVSQGLYARARPSLLDGKPIPVKGLATLTAALARLGIETVPSRLTQAYNAGRRAHDASADGSGRGSETARPLQNRLQRNLSELRACWTGTSLKQPHFVVPARTMLKIPDQYGTVRNFVYRARPHVASKFLPSIRVTSKGEAATPLTP
jgi:hypothetical protein